MVEQMTREFKIDKNLYFRWIQLVLAIPNYWKKTQKILQIAKIYLI